jgi:segregation and condensation protein B
MLTPPAALEAVLFASGEPLAKKDAAKFFGITLAQLAQVTEALIAELEKRGVSLIETSNELELRTSPEAADLIKKLRESELSRDLGKAGLETLAVIAYREGATRSEIDWVRGVNSSTSVRSLLLRGLIEGHEDEKDRRRVRYEVTTDALAHLGLRKTSDLPRFNELAKQATAVVNEEQHAAE